MRFGLIFRSVSDMCRSSTSAAPRAEVRDSSADMENATGELSPSLIWTAPEGSRPSCATRAPAHSRSRPGLKLFHIDSVDRYVARVGIHVASPHGALRSHHQEHALRAGALQPERMRPVSRFDS